jgi:hypothetical protein
LGGAAGVSGPAATKDKLLWHRTVGFGPRSNFLRARAAA